MKLTTHPQLVPNSRRCRSINPVPHTPSLQRSPARHTECSQLDTTRKTTWTKGLWSGSKMRTVQRLWATNPVPSSQHWALPPLERITPTLRTRYPYLRPEVEGTDLLSMELPNCSEEEFWFLQLCPFCSSSECRKKVYVCMCEAEHSLWHNVRRRRTLVLWQ
jgi:hypothetical protein